MQLDNLKLAPRSQCSVVIPEYRLLSSIYYSSSFWNDNFGSVYRNRLLLVSLGKEKDITMNV